MKLEVGKYYRTRGGNKARIICDDVKGAFRPIIALANVGEKEYTLYSDPSGSVSVVDNEHDLISEWIDKPEFDWSKAAAWHVAVAKLAINGKWYAFDKAPEYVYSHECFGYANGTNFHACEQIPDQYAPVWEGDAKDSLIIRPGYEVIS